MTRFRPALYLSAALALAACSKGEKKEDVLAQDSSLTRDIELANRDTAAQPQLKDVPVTPPPAPPAPTQTAPRRVATAPRHTTPRPAPTPPPPPPPAPVTTPSGNRIETASHGPEGHVGTIAAGTTIGLQSGQRVCTNTNSVGDRFTASLAQAVTGSNGVVIPAGATAVLEVTSLKRSENAGDNMAIGVVVRSISYAGKTYPVSGEVTNAETSKVRASDNNDAAKVAGGAAVGAVLGRIFAGKSKTKSTIIGAAGGAAAGAILANQTGKYDACIPSGGRITVRLNSAMQVQSVGSESTNNGL